MTNIEKAAELILLCAQKQILKKAVFSKPESENTLRMTATLRIIKGRPALQVERLTRDNKAHHQNISLDGGAAELCSLVSKFRQVNIITTVGDSEYRRSASGKDTLLGGDKLTSAAQKAEGGTVSVGGNDKKKNYILDGSEKFLILLGVSDKNGRPHDKKLPKLRQMDLRLYEAALDLGCNPRQAFFKAVLPEIMPGIISGLLMSFTYSMDDFVISYFNSGTIQTLPIAVYSMTRKKVSPEINALSTILFMVILSVVLISNAVGEHKEKKSHVH